MNLDLLRSFSEITRQGSLSKAAERLRVSQSTLTRQMDTLEHEVGGKLLERGSTGVALTAAGHVLLEGMRPLLAQFDKVMSDTRRSARGQSDSLRIGYLLSAVSDYLQPALLVLRREHPEVKVKLVDLSPGQQIEALRDGRIDVAMVGSAGSLLVREFYVRKLGTLPVVAAVSETSPLSAPGPVALADLRSALFIGAPDSDMPGYNRWVVQICRRAGFRPRFVENAEGLTHALATVVTEGAVALLPDFAGRTPVPGVAFRPVGDKGVNWDFLVAWQRGRTTEPMRALLEALDAAARAPGIGGNARGPGGEATEKPRTHHRS